MKLLLLIILPTLITFADNHEKKMVDKKVKKKEMKDAKAEARQKMFLASKQMFIDVKKKQMARHQVAIECAEKALDQEALKNCRKENRMAKDELKSDNKARRESMQELRKNMREKLRSKKRNQKKSE
ncbi:hypothetical protein N9N67_05680 [Bacteriovoracaceae bacterium]|nr:hypothetical protein [Bacteriovoracaceae bacterium]